MPRWLATHPSPESQPSIVRIHGRGSEGAESGDPQRLKESQLCGGCVMVVLFAVCVSRLSSSPPRTQNTMSSPNVSFHPNLDRSLARHTRHAPPKPTKQKAPPLISRKLGAAWVVVCWCGWGWGRGDGDGMGWGNWGWRTLFPPPRWRWHGNQGVVENA